MDWVDKLEVPFILSLVFGFGFGYATIKVSAALKTKENEKDHMRINERLDDHDVDIVKVNVEVSNLKASILKVFTLFEGMEKRFDLSDKKIDELRYSMDKKFEEMRDWMRMFLEKKA